MNIMADGKPLDLLKAFEYSKHYHHNAPEICAEHGTFIYEGKKYSIEFVKRELPYGRNSRWVVSRISFFCDPDVENAELVYDIKEEKMQREGNGRKAFLVIAGDIPLLAVTDSEKGVVKVYEMEDLVHGIPLKFGNEFMRFRPKSYDTIKRHKEIASIALEKSYTLMIHEESRGEYEKYASFILDNQLMQRLK